MHPLPLREENDEAREGEKKSLHFNGSDENIELLLRTVISSNQLSVCGAIVHYATKMEKGLVLEDGFSRIRESDQT